MSYLPLAIYLHLRQQGLRARLVISWDREIGIPSPDAPQWHDMADILTGIKGYPRYCFNHFYEPFGEYSQVPRHSQD